MILIIYFLYTTKINPFIANTDDKYNNNMPLKDFQFLGKLGKQILI